MIDPCDTCALTPGSAANLEPHNALKAEICLLGGLPFYCHHNQSWADLNAPKMMTGEEIRAKCLRVCIGWKREVARLAADGYFKRGRSMKKARGEIALEALQISNSINVDAETKAEASAEVERLVEILRRGAEVRAKI